MDCAACGCAIWSWFKLDSLLLFISARYVLEEGLNRPAFNEFGERPGALESMVLVRLPLVVGRDISVKNCSHECGFWTEARGVLSALSGGVGGKRP